MRQDAEKPLFAVFAVIPAEAGIQYLQAFLDSRLRGSDQGIPLLYEHPESGSRSLKPEGTSGKHIRT